MAILARILLLIPSIVAGWFVSREDPRYWVIALVVGLTFMALSIAAGLYVPALRFWPSRGR